MKLEPSNLIVTPKNDQISLKTYIALHTVITEKLSFHNVLHLILKDLHKTVANYPATNPIFICDGLLEKVFETKYIHKDQICIFLSKKLNFHNGEPIAKTSKKKKKHIKNPIFKIPKCLKLLLLQMPKYDGESDFHSLEYLTEHIHDYLQTYAKTATGNKDIFVPGNDSLFRLLPYKAVYRPNCDAIVETLCQEINFHTNDLTEIFMSDSETD